MSEIRKWTEEEWQRAEQEAQAKIKAYEEALLTLDPAVIYEAGRKYGNTAEWQKIYDAGGYEAILITAHQDIAVRLTMPPDRAAESRKWLVERGLSWNS